MREPLQCLARPSARPRINGPLTHGLLNAPARARAHGLVRGRGGAPQPGRRSWQSWWRSRARVTNGSVAWVCSALARRACLRAPAVVCSCWRAVASWRRRPGFQRDCSSVWRCVTALAYLCSASASSAAGSVSIASVLAVLVLSCRGEAFDRVARLGLGRADLGVRVVWLSRCVEVVGVTAAAQRGVARLAREPAIGEHEGLVDGEALGDVAGDRVAVCERRVAVLGAAMEEAGAELDACGLRTRAVAVAGLGRRRARGRGRRC